MIIAVVQHRLRAVTAEDVRGLGQAVEAACDGGAEFVVTPCVPGLAPEAVRNSVASEVRARNPRCAYFAPSCYSPSGWGFVEAIGGATALGQAVAMAGDACFDESVWRSAREARPHVAVLSPLSESDLQVEAALEVAIGLSDALCGLVIVAECSGAPLGEPGHGGSAIVVLGKVVAEAFDEDEIVYADIALPVPRPEPPGPLPEVPTILAQRVALHEGRKPDVGYLADLSNGRKDR